MSVDVFISAEKIQSRLKEMAKIINEQYQGEELALVCVLKGSFILCADLIRLLTVPVKMEFISLSSYGSGKKSSGEVKKRFSVISPLQGRHILVVEDIIDTGLTLATLIEDLKTQKPASVKLLSLLLKPSKLEHPLQPDYIGFEIPDKFVVGYGLDYNENYRELPYVGILNED